MGLSRCGISALLAVGITLLAVGGAPSMAQEVTGDKPIGDRVHVLTVKTNAFSQPTNVDVFLPTGYGADPSRRWPVTYVLAGTMNNYDSFRNVLKGIKLTEHYPSLIVSPDGNSGYWSDWYNGGAFGPPEYETFVIKQLIPLIDARYRTAADRAHRLVTGVSMGGYGAAMFAARHPDLFAAVSSISGADDSNLPYLAAAVSASSTFDGGPVDGIYGPRATQEVRWRGHNPVDLASNLRDVDVQIRTANGIPAPEIGENPASADTASCAIEQGVYQGSMSFHNELIRMGKAHLYKDYGNGCHTFPNFTRQTIDTLSAFEKLLANPPHDPATFDFRSMEPAFDIWGWHIEADPARALEFMRAEGSQNRLKLTGSGTTTVTTPAFFRGVGEVGLIGARETTATPDATGRIRFTVDLGPPNADQQYTVGARTTETKRTVAFAPGAVVGVSPAPSVSGACASRRHFMIHVRPPRGVSYVRVVVRVGSRRIRVARRGRSFVGRVDLRGLRRGRFSVGITAVTTAGSTIRSVRRYRTCTPGRRARSGSR